MADTAGSSHGPDQNNDVTAESHTAISPGHKYGSVVAGDNAQIHMGDVYHVHPPLPGKSRTPLPLLIDKVDIWICKLLQVPESPKYWN